jgi:hypothetical protein
MEEVSLLKAEATRQLRALARGSLAELSSRAASGEPGARQAHEDLEARLTVTYADLARHRKNVPSSRKANLVSQAAWTARIVAANVLRVPYTDRATHQEEVSPTPEADLTAQAGPSTQEGAHRREGRAAGAGKGQPPAPGTVSGEPPLVLERSGGLSGGAPQMAGPAGAGESSAAAARREALRQPQALEVAAEEDPAKLQGLDSEDMRELLFPGNEPGPLLRGASRVLLRVLLGSVSFQREASGHLEGSVFFRREASGHLEVLELLARKIPSDLRRLDRARLGELFFPLPAGEPGPWAGKASRRLVEAMLANEWFQRELRERQGLLTWLFRDFHDVPGMAQAMRATLPRLSTRELFGPGDLAARMAAIAAPGFAARARDAMGEPDARLLAALGATLPAVEAATVPEDREDRGRMSAWVGAALGRENQSRVLLAPGGRLGWVFASGRVAEVALGDPRVRAAVAAHPDHPALLDRLAGGPSGREGAPLGNRAAWVSLLLAGGDLDAGNLDQVLADPAGRGVLSSWMWARDWLAGNEHRAALAELGEREPDVLLGLYFPAGGEGGPWTRRLSEAGGEEADREGMAWLLGLPAVQRELVTQLGPLEWLAKNVPDVLGGLRPAILADILAHSLPDSLVGMDFLLEHMVGTAAGRRELRTRPEVVARLVRDLPERVGALMSVEENRREVLGGKSLAQWVDDALDDPGPRAVLLAPGGGGPPWITHPELVEMALDNGEVERALPGYPRVLAKLADSHHDDLERQHPDVMESWFFHGGEPGAWTQYLTGRGLRWLLRGSSAVFRYLYRHPEVRLEVLAHLVRHGHAATVEQVAHQSVNAAGLLLPGSQTVAERVAEALGNNRARAVLLPPGGSALRWAVGAGLWRVVLDDEAAQGILAGDPQALTELVRSHRGELARRSADEVDRMFFSGDEPGEWSEYLTLADVRSLLGTPTLSWPGLPAFEQGMRQHPAAVAWLMRHGHAAAVAAAVPDKASARRLLRQDSLAQWMRRALRSARLRAVLVPADGAPPAWVLPLGGVADSGAVGLLAVEAQLAQAALEDPELRKAVGGDADLFARLLESFPDQVSAALAEPDAARELLPVTAGQVPVWLRTAVVEGWLELGSVRRVLSGSREGLRDLVFRRDRILNELLSRSAAAYQDLFGTHPLEAVVREALDSPAAGTDSELPVPDGMVLASWLKLSHPRVIRVALGHRETWSLLGDRVLLDWLSGQPELVEMLLADAGVRAALRLRPPAVTAVKEALGAPGVPAVVVEAALGLPGAAAALLGLPGEKLVGMLADKAELSNRQARRLLKANAGLAGQVREEVAVARWQLALASLALWGVDVAGTGLAGDQAPAEVVAEALREEGALSQLFPEKPAELLPEKPAELLPEKPGPLWTDRAPRVTREVAAALLGAPGAWEFLVRNRLEALEALALAYPEVVAKLVTGGLAREILGTGTPEDLVAELLQAPQVRDAVIKTKGAPRVLVGAHRGLVEDIAGSAAEGAASAEEAPVEPEEDYDLPLEEESLYWMPESGEESGDRLDQAWALEVLTLDDNAGLKAGAPSRSTAVGQGSAGAGSAATAGQDDSERDDQDGSEEKEKEEVRMRGGAGPERNERARKLGQGMRKLWEEKARGAAPGRAPVLMPPARGTLPAGTLVSAVPKRGLLVPVEYAGGKVRVGKGEPWRDEEALAGWLRGFLPWERGLRQAYVLVPLGPPGGIDLARLRAYAQRASGLVTGMVLVADPDAGPGPGAGGDPWAAHHAGVAVGPGLRFAALAGAPVDQHVTVSWVRRGWWAPRSTHDERARERERAEAEARRRGGYLEGVMQAAGLIPRPDAQAGQDTVPGIYVESAAERVRTAGVRADPWPSVFLMSQLDFLLDRGTEKELQGRLEALRELIMRYQRPRRENPGPQVWAVSDVPMRHLRAASAGGTAWQELDQIGDWVRENVGRDVRVSEYKQLLSVVGKWARDNEVTLVNVLQAASYNAVWLNGPLGKDGGASQAVLAGLAVAARQARRDGVPLPVLWTGVPPGDLVGGGPAGYDARVAEMLELARQYGFTVRSADERAGELKHPKLLETYRAARHPLADLLFVLEGAALDGGVWFDAVSARPLAPNAQQLVLAAAWRSPSLTASGAAGGAAGRSSVAVVAAAEPGAPGAAALRDALARHLGSPYAELVGSGLDSVLDAAEEEAFIRSGRGALFEQVGLALVEQGGGLGVIPAGAFWVDEGHGWRLREWAARTLPGPSLEDLDLSLPGSVVERPGAEHPGASPPGLPGKGKGKQPEAEVPEPPFALWDVASERQLALRALDDLRGSLASKEPVDDDMLYYALIDVLAGAVPEEAAPVLADLFQAAPDQTGWTLVALLADQFPYGPDLGEDVTRLMAAMISAEPAAGTLRSWLDRAGPLLKVLDPGLPRHLGVELPAQLSNRQGRRWVGQLHRWQQAWAQAPLARSPARPSMAARLADDLKDLLDEATDELLEEANIDGTLWRAVDAFTGPGREELERAFRRRFDAIGARLPARIVRNTPRPQPPHIHLVDHVHVPNQRLVLVGMLLRRGPPGEKPTVQLAGPESPTLSLEEFARWLYERALPDPPESPDRPGRAFVLVDQEALLSAPAGDRLTALRGQMTQVAQVVEWNLGHVYVPTAEVYFATDPVVPPLGPGEVRPPPIGAVPRYATVADSLLPVSVPHPGPDAPVADRALYSLHLWQKAQIDQILESQGPLAASREARRILQARDRERVSFQAKARAAARNGPPVSVPQPLVLSEAAGLSGGAPAGAASSRAGAGEETGAPGGQELTQGQRLRAALASDLEALVGGPPGEVLATALAGWTRRLGEGPAAAEVIFGDVPAGLAAGYAGALAGAGLLARDRGRYKAVAPSGVMQQVMGDQVLREALLGSGDLGWAGRLPADEVRVLLRDDAALQALGGQPAAVAGLVWYEHAQVIAEQVIADEGRDVPGVTGLMLGGKSLKEWVWEALADPGRRPVLLPPDLRTPWWVADAALLDGSADNDELRRSLPNYPDLLGHLANQRGDVLDERALGELGEMFFPGGEPGEAAWGNYLDLNGARWLLDRFFAGGAAGGRAGGVRGWGAGEPFWRDLLRNPEIRRALFERPLVLRPLADAFPGALRQLPPVELADLFFPPDRDQGSWVDHTAARLLGVLLGDPADAGQDPPAVLSEVFKAIAAAVGDEDGTYVAQVAEAVVAGWASLLRDSGSASAEDIFRGLPDPQGYADALVAAGWLEPDGGRYRARFAPPPASASTDAEGVWSARRYWAYVHPDPAHRRRIVGALPAPPRAGGGDQAAAVPVADPLEVRLWDHARGDGADPGLPGSLRAALAGRPNDAWLLPWLLRAVGELLAGGPRRIDDLEQRLGSLTVQLGRALGLFRSLTASRHRQLVFRPPSWMTGADLREVVGLAGAGSGRADAGGDFPLAVEARLGLLPVVPMPVTGRGALARLDPQADVVVAEAAWTRALARPLSLREARRDFGPGVLRLLVNSGQGEVVAGPDGVVRVAGRLRPDASRAGREAAEAAAASLDEGSGRALDDLRAAVVPAADGGEWTAVAVAALAVSGAPGSREESNRRGAKAAEWAGTVQGRAALEVLLRGPEGGLLALHLRSWLWGESVLKAVLADPDTFARLIDSDDFADVLGVDAVAGVVLDAALAVLADEGPRAVIARRAGLPARLANERSVAVRYLGADVVRDLYLDPENGGVSAWAGQVNGDGLVVLLSHSVVRQVLAGDDVVLGGLLRRLPGAVVNGSLHSNRELFGDEGLPGWLDRVLADAGLRQAIFTNADVRGEYPILEIMDVLSDQERVRVLRKPAVRRWLSGSVAELRLLAAAIPLLWASLDHETVHALYFSVRDRELLPWAEHDPGEELDEGIGVLLGNSFFWQEVSEPRWEPLLRELMWSFPLNVVLAAEGAGEAGPGLVAAVRAILDGPAADEDVARWLLSLRAGNWWLASSPAAAGAVLGHPRGRRLLLSDPWSVAELVARQEPVVVAALADPLVMSDLFPPGDEVPGWLGELADNGLMTVLGSGAVRVLLAGRRGALWWLAGARPGPLRGVLEAYPDARDELFGVHPLPELAAEVAAELARGGVPWRLWSWLEDSDPVAGVAGLGNAAVRELLFPPGEEPDARLLLERLGRLHEDVLAAALGYAGPGEHVSRSLPVLSWLMRHHPAKVGQLAAAYGRLFAVHSLDTVLAEVSRMLQAGPRDGGRAAARWLTASPPAVIRKVLSQEALAGLVLEDGQVESWLASDPRRLAPLLADPLVRRVLLADRGRAAVLLRNVRFALPGPQARRAAVKELKERLEQGQARQREGQHLRRADEIRALARVNRAEDDLRAAGALARPELGEAAGVARAGAWRAEAAVREAERVLRRARDALARPELGEAVRLARQEAALADGEVRRARDELRAAGALDRPDLVEEARLALAAAEAAGEAVRRARQAAAQAEGEVRRARDELRAAGALDRPDLVEEARLALAAAEALRAEGKLAEKSQEKQEADAHKDFQKRWEQAADGNPLTAVLLADPGWLAEGLHGGGKLARVLLKSRLLLAGITRDAPALEAVTALAGQRPAQPADDADDADDADEADDAEEADEGGTRARLLAAATPAQWTEAMLGDKDYERVLLPAGGDLSWVDGLPADAAAVLRRHLAASGDPGTARPLLLGEERAAGARGGAPAMAGSPLSAVPELLRQPLIRLYEAVAERVRDEDRHAPRPADSRDSRWRWQGNREQLPDGGPEWEQLPPEERYDLSGEASGDLGAWAALEAWARHLGGGVAPAWRIFGVPGMVGRVAEALARELEANGWLEYHPVREGDWPRPAGYRATLPAWVRELSGAQAVEVRGWAMLHPDPARRRAILALLPPPLPGSYREALAADGLDPVQAARLLSAFIARPREPAPVFADLSLGFQEAQALLSALLRLGGLEQEGSSLRVSELSPNPLAADELLWELSVWGADMLPEGMLHGAEVIPVPAGLRAALAGWPDGPRILTRVHRTWVRLLKDGPLLVEEVDHREAAEIWVLRELGWARVLEVPDDVRYAALPVLAGDEAIRLEPYLRMFPHPGAALARVGLLPGGLEVLAAAAAALGRLALPVEVEVAGAAWFRLLHSPMPTGSAVVYFGHEVIAQLLTVGLAANVDGYTMGRVGDSTAEETQALASALHHDPRLTDPQRAMALGNLQPALSAITPLLPAAARPPAWVMEMLREYIRGPGATMLGDGQWKAVWDVLASLLAGGGYSSRDQVGYALPRWAELNDPAEISLDSYQTALGSLSLTAGLAGGQDWPAAAVLPLPGPGGVAGAGWRAWEEFADGVPHPVQRARLRARLGMLAGPPELTGRAAVFLRGHGLDEEGILEVRRAWGLLHMFWGLSVGHLAAAFRLGGYPRKEALARAAALPGLLEAAGLARPRAGPDGQTWYEAWYPADIGGTSFTALINWVAGDRPTLAWMQLRTIASVGPRTSAPDETGRELLHAPPGKGYAWLTTVGDLRLSGHRAGDPRVVNVDLIRPAGWAREEDLSGALSDPLKGQQLERAFMDDSGFAWGLHGDAGSARAIFAAEISHYRPDVAAVLPGRLVVPRDLPGGGVVPGDAAGVLERAVGPDLVGAVVEVWAGVLRSGGVRREDLLTAPRGYPRSARDAFDGAVRALREAELQLDEEDVAELLAAAGLAGLAEVEGMGPVVMAEVPRGATPGELAGLARLAPVNDPWPVLALLLRHYLAYGSPELKGMQEAQGDASSLASLADEDVALWGLLVARGPHSGSQVAGAFTGPRRPALAWLVALHLSDVTVAGGGVVHTARRLPGSAGADQMADEPWARVRAAVRAIVDAALPVGGGAGGQGTGAGPRENPDDGPQAKRRRGSEAPLSLGEEGAAGARGGAPAGGQADPAGAGAGPGGAARAAGPAREEGGVAAAAGLPPGVMRVVDLLVAGRVLTPEQRGLAAEAYRIVLGAAGYAGLDQVAASVPGRDADAGEVTGALSRSLLVPFSGEGSGIGAALLPLPGPGAGDGAQWAQAAAGVAGPGRRQRVEARLGMLAGPPELPERAAAALGDLPGPAVLLVRRAWGLYRMYSALSPAQLRDALVLGGERDPGAATELAGVLVGRMAGAGLLRPRPGPGGLVLHEASFPGGPGQAGAGPGAGRGWGAGDRAVAALDEIRLLAQAGPGPVLAPGGAGAGSRAAGPGSAWAWLTVDGGLRLARYAPGPGAPEVLVPLDDGAPGGGPGGGPGDALADPAAAAGLAAGRVASWARALGVPGEVMEGFLAAEMRPYRAPVAGPGTASPRRVVPAESRLVLKSVLGLDLAGAVLDAVALVWAGALVRGALAGDLFTVPAGYGMEARDAFEAAVAVLRGAGRTPEAVAGALRRAGLARIDGGWVAGQVPDTARLDDLIQMAPLAAAEDPWPVLGLLLRHYLRRAALPWLRDVPWGRLPDQELGLWGLLVARGRLTTGEIGLAFAGSRPPAPAWLTTLELAEAEAGPDGSVAAYAEPAGSALGGTRDGAAVADIVNAVLRRELEGGRALRAVTEADLAARVGGPAGEVLAAALAGWAGALGKEPAAAGVIFGDVPAGLAAGYAGALVAAGWLASAGGGYVAVLPLAARWPEGAAMREVISDPVLGEALLGLGDLGWAARLPPGALTGLLADDGAQQALGADEAAVAALVRHRRARAVEEAVRGDPDAAARLLGGRSLARWVGYALGQDHLRAVLAPAGGGAPWWILDPGLLEAGLDDDEVRGLVRDDPYMLSLLARVRWRELDERPAEEVGEMFFSADVVAWSSHLDSSGARWLLGRFFAGGPGLVAGMAGGREADEQLWAGLLGGAGVRRALFEMPELVRGLAVQFPGALRGLEPAALAEVFLDEEAWGEPWAGDTAVRLLGHLLGAGAAGEGPAGAGPGAGPLEVTPPDQAQDQAQARGEDGGGEDGGEGPGLPAGLRAAVAGHPDGALLLPGLLGAYRELLHDGLRESF